MPDLGNLWYTLGINDKTEGRIKEIARKLQDELSSNPMKVKIGSVELSSDAANSLLQSLERQIGNSAISARVNSLVLDSSAATSLAAQVADALANSKFTLRNFDVSGLKTSLAAAVKESIEMAKPTIIERIRQALTSGSNKIKIEVDARAIAKSVSDAIAKQEVKLGKMSFNGNVVAQQIEEALRGKQFKINIAIDRMNVEAAIQDALTRAGMKGLGSFSASDARLARANNEALRAADRHALAQAKLAAMHDRASRAAEKHSRYEKAISDQMRTSTQVATILGNAIGNVFSVYAVKSFLTEVVKVGGELEKQRLAMGAIMGDTYQASEIYNKVAKLSMISPFDVEDLMKYSKQLNAFGIKYSELYDTTKRLSDIAAAVGVDFGRIAYEFGQTSARGWLDGRELRMFANSGIPLLQKLAEYYTKARNEIVSAAEVREMITKREVSFQDVKAVLWEMTNAGGEFYQMQEVMAESLAAKWRNLGNAWNLMMGDIAESGVGKGLKTLAEVLTDLTNNWGTVATVIGLVSTKMVAATLTQRTYNTALAAGTKEALAMMEAESVRANMMRAYGSGTAGAFATGLAAGYRTITKEAFASAVATGRLTSAQLQQLVVSRNMPAFYYDLSKAERIAYLQTLGFAEAEAKAAVGSSVLSARLGQLTGQFAAMAKAMLFNPTTLVFAGISTAVMLWERYVEKQREAEERTEKIAEKAKEGFKNIEDALKSAELTTRPVNEAGFKQAFDKMKEIIKDYAPDWQDIFYTAFGDGVDKGIEDLAERYDFLKSKVEELKTSYDKLNESKGIFEGANDKTGGFLELWNDTALTNLKDANDEIEKMNKLILEAAKDPFQADMVINKLAELDQGFAKWLTGHSNASRYDKLLEAIKNYQRQVQGIVNDDVTTNFVKMQAALSQATNFQKEMSKASKDATDLADEVERTLIALKGADYVFTDIDKRSLRMQVDVVLDEKGISDADIREGVHRLFEERGLEDPIIHKNYVELLPDNKPKEDDDKNKNKTDEQLKAWQEQFSKLKEAYTEYKRWYDLYKNDQDAIAKTRENPLFADLDIDPSNLKKNLEDLRDRIQATTKARRDLQLKIGGEIFTIDYNAIKEQATKAADAMKEQLAEEAKRWNIATALNGAGMDMGKAMDIAFKSDIQMFDRISRELADRLAAAMFDKGMLLNPDEEFGVSFKMTEKEAQQFFGSNGELYQLWKQVKDHIEKNGIDFLSRSAKSMSDFSNIEERIVTIRKRMEEEIAEATSKGYDSTIIEGIRKDYNEQISKLRQEFFEGSDVYKKLTQDTTNFGVAKLTELRNLAKKIKEAMDSGTASRDKNGNLVRAFTLDGKDYEVTERSYESIVKLIAKLEKKSQSATESFKRMWKWLNGGDKELKFADVAKDIQAVFASLGETAEQLSQLFGTDTSAGKVAGAIGGSFKGLQQITEAFDMFKSGDYLGGINGTLQGINTAVSAIQSLMPEDKNAKLIDAMHDMQASFEKSIDNLSFIMQRQNVDDAYKTYLEQQERILELQRLTAENIKEQAQNYRNHFFVGAARNYHSVGSYIDDYLSGNDWDRLNQLLGVSNVDELLSMSSKQWFDLITQLPDLWRKIQDAISADKDNPVSETLAQDIEEYSEMWKQMQEQSAAWAEYVTGVAFADVQSSFDSLIKNMSASWQDYTDSFEEQMFNAIVRYEQLQRLGTEEEGLQAEYYRKLAEYSTGGYTAEEIAELRAMWEDMAHISEDIKEDASALSGWDGGKAASSLSSAIQGVSAEQVDLLAAYANGIRGDMSVTRAMVEQMVLSLMPTMGINASAQLAQLNLISENTRQIAESNAAIRDYVESLDARLRSVTEGTERIYVR